MLNFPHLGNKVSTRVPQFSMFDAVMDVCIMLTKHRIRIKRTPATNCETFRNNSSYFTNKQASINTNQKVIFHACDIIIIRALFMEILTTIA